MSKKDLTDKSECYEIADCIFNEPPGSWPNDFEKWPNTQKVYRQLQSEFRHAVPQYNKEEYVGRGIVICGGGTKYFPGVYVNCKIIRMLGMEHPIEVWYLGEYEMDFGMIKMIEDIGNIKCINARQVEKKYPSRILYGWELKTYACIHSSFQETFLLDSDNTPVRHLDYIFNSDQYRNTGAILWPDYTNPWTHDERFWEIIGIPNTGRPEVESGQVLVDKSKRWEELNVAHLFSEHSDYYYKLYYGDKESFNMGFNYFNRPYAQPDFPGWANNSIIVQKDFNKKWLFSHRAQCKFRLDKTHPICMESPYEQKTLDYLDELRTKWDGGLWVNQNPTKEEIEFGEFLKDKYFIYNRHGLGERIISFSRFTNNIAEGSARMERYYQIFFENENKWLIIHGDSEPTCKLKFCNDGSFKGKWFRHEECETSLTPYSPA